MFLSDFLFQARLHKESAMSLEQASCGRRKQRMKKELQDYHPLAPEDGSYICTLRIVNVKILH